MFELQRVDRQHPQIIYSGTDTEYELKALRPVEHLQFRVRAVLLDTEGQRFEVLFYYKYFLTLKIIFRAIGPRLVLFAPCAVHLLLLVDCTLNNFLN
jgi:hypothetical protein